MRTSLKLLVFCALVLVVFHGTAQAHPAASPLPSIGSTVTVQGIAVKLVAVQRAHEAGAADYIAGKGNIFLLVTVQIIRKGGHDSYLADPADFSVQTSTGAVIDSESFGMAKEFQAKHLYTGALSGVIGFEVPAKDKSLMLLWQPNLPSNPDAQAQWLIGARGATVQYYQ
jgi:hypothetical protein